MPWTDATTGFGRCTIACIIALQAFMISAKQARPRSASLRRAVSSFMSWPAEKAEAVGGEHDGADALVVADLVQRAVQLGDHAFRQAVARRRAVEREYRDTADGLAQQDRGVRHCAGGADKNWADMVRFHYESG